MNLDNLYQLLKKYTFNSRIGTFINTLGDYSNEDLWILHGIIEQAIVATSPTKMTRNITGERAADLAIEFYRKTTFLPMLSKADPGAKDFDAYSTTNGKRYSIKGFKGSTKTSSSICAFNENNTDYNFEYVILAKIDFLNQLTELIEIPLNTASKYAKLNKRDKNFKISYTNKLKNDPSTKILFESSKHN